MALPASLDRFWVERSLTMLVGDGAFTLTCPVSAILSLSHILGDSPKSCYQGHDAKFEGGNCDPDIHVEQ